jgi:hypothetical protein
LATTAFLASSALGGDQHVELALPHRGDLRDHALVSLSDQTHLGTDLVLGCLTHGAVLL